MYKLAEKWNIDKNSFMIGDQLTDMQFGKKSQIRGYMLILGIYILL